MSLENLQTLSKLSPNSKKYACTIFCSNKICVQPLKKKLWTHIFWSLERVWRFSKLIFFLFLKKTLFFEKWHQAKISLWVWSEFGYSPSSLQTHMFSFFSFFLFFWKRGMSLEWVWRFFKLSPNSLQAHMFFLFHLLWGEERNEFGVRLEIFQTFSKLTSNSLQTQMISFFRVFFLYGFFHVCLEKTIDLGVSWEIIQKLSRLAPNSYVFIFPLSFSFLFTFFLDKRNEFGVGLEILQTLSKLICFFYFFCSLEKRNEFGVWSDFGDSPNSVQTRSKLMFFFLCHNRKNC